MENLLVCISEKLEAVERVESCAVHLRPTTG